MLRLFKLTLVLMALAFMATSPAQARAFFWYADGKGNIITEPVEKDPPVETAASTPTAVDTPSTPHSGQASGNTADAPPSWLPAGGLLALAGLVLGYGSMLAGIIQKRHLITAGLVLAALALYAAGADSGSAGFIIAGVAFEMAFWVRLLPRRQSRRDTPP